MNEISTGAIVLRAVVNCMGLLIFSQGLRPRVLLRPDGRPVPLWGSVVVGCALFAALCASVVLIRLSHLLFLSDFVAVIAVFSLWLLTAKRISVRNALYMAVVAFLCLDLTVALVNSAYRHLPTFSTPFGSAALELLYAALMLGLCWMLRRWAHTSDERDVSLRSFLMLFLALAPYLVMRSSALFYDIGGPTGTMIEGVLALTIVATFGAFVGNHATIVAAAEKVRRLQLEMELQEHQRRFAIRKEAMDEVNRRYHDMVRYARIFAQGGAAGSFDEFLEERMTGNLPTTPMRDTGNDTLDMLLWEASERCAASDIRFVPIVDVEDVGAIAGFDLHAIVGNALENAVEAASRVPDREKREVRLKLRQVNQMLFVVVNNHFVGELRREGDRLVSTKDRADEGPHGYGVENIRRAAERYGGSLTYAAQGDRFSLTVMVPLG